MVDGEGSVIQVNTTDLANRTRAREKFFKENLKTTTWSRSESVDGGHTKEKFREHKVYEKKMRNGVTMKAKKTRVCCVLKRGQLLGGRLPTKEMCEYLRLKYPYGRPRIAER